MRICDIKQLFDLYLESIKPAQNIDLKLKDQTKEVQASPGTYTGNIRILDWDNRPVLYIVIDETNLGYHCLKVSNYIQFASNDDVILPCDGKEILVEIPNAFYLSHSEVSSSILYERIGAFEMLELQRIVLDGTTAPQSIRLASPEYITLFHKAEYELTNKLRFRHNPPSPHLMIPSLQWNYSPDQQFAASSVHCLSSEAGLSDPFIGINADEFPAASHILSRDQEYKVWMKIDAELQGKYGKIFSNEDCIFEGILPSLALVCEAWVLDLADLHQKLNLAIVY